MLVSWLPLEGPSQGSTPDFGGDGVWGRSRTGMQSGIKELVLTLAEKGPLCTQKTEGSHVAGFPGPQWHKGELGLNSQLLRPRL